MDMIINSVLYIDIFDDAIWSTRQTLRGGCVDLLYSRGFYMMNNSGRYFQPNYGRVLWI